jgi:hypothetical protein
MASRWWKSPIGRVVSVLGVLLALLIFGNWLYWWADGSPGTPAEFRENVAETGLDVAWMTSGPRGGSGVVETSCGPTDVDIDDINDVLWIRWEGNREPVSSEVIDALLGCSLN